MTGASIETTLELWASSLRDVKARMRGLFTQVRVAASAGAFLDGLLGDERRKTGWMRAEAAGDPGPWRQQAILGRGRWDADALRDTVREYVVETLAADDAVLVIDETGFLKQGKASCGVGDIEQALRRAGKGYVLGVNANHHFGSWAGKPAIAGTADEIARGLDPSVWRRLSAGEGTKGARLHDWGYCELADLDAAEYDGERSGLWTPNL